MNLQETHLLAKFLEFMFSGYMT